MKSLQELIELYNQDMRLRGFAKSTIETGMYHFRYLENYLKEHTIESVCTVTESTLEEFRHWLFYKPTQKGKMRSIAVQNRVLARLKGFFAFLHQSGYMGHNPTANLAYAKEPKSLPREVLTPREARKILEKIDTSSLLGYRDRTLMEVFYATGIRVGELIALQVSDVDLDDELLRINQGKGGHDRVVPLGNVACHYLETYLNGVRLKLAQNHEIPELFLSHRGRPMQKPNIWVIVDKHARAARIKKKVNCHLWRHTCATHLLKNNANLRHVQALLGHRRLSTTERYLHLTISDLKAAHKKCHPREQKGKKGKNS